MSQKFSVDVNKGGAGANRISVIGTSYGLHNMLLIESSNSKGGSDRPGNVTRLNKRLEY